MVNDFKERIERIVTALAKATCQDFDHTLELAEKEDELFELEVGVNVLLQDLASSKRSNDAALAQIEAKNREIAERQSLALRELATPIISVWSGVLALPVIGIVDTARSADMMDSLLARVVQEQATHVIIDITGVGVLDTRTADHFVRMAKAVVLLGSRCFLTGMSPAIAQTLAQLGVDTSSARTVRRLSDALQIVFAELAVPAPQA